jgi:hypothetical protein
VLPQQTPPICTARISIIGCKLIARVLIVVDQQAVDFTYGASNAYMQHRWPLGFACDLKTFHGPSNFLPPRG